MELLTSDTKPVTQLIDEQVHHCKLELIEGTGERKGRVYAKGEFGHAAKPTANKRLYPAPIWEHNIKRLRESLSDRKVLGELDHPSDGRTALQRASHVITDLHLEDDRVMGEAEILDTSKGKDLKAILAAGVPVGVSSRGFGSTKPDGDGNEVVQEDYKLITFDFVAEPADDTAYPDVFFEGVEFSMDKGSATDSEQKMADEFAKKVEAERGTSLSTEALRAEFEGTILVKLEAMRDEVRKEVRAEMLADPEVAGARTALEQVQNILRPFALSEDAAVVMAAKDEEIAALQQRLTEAEQEIEGQRDLIEKLVGAAKEAGYKFHLERLIQGEPEADLLRKLVGEVVQFSSPQALEARLEEARTEVQSHLVQEEDSQRRMQAKQDRLKDKNRELAEGLERALEAQRELALQVYASKRLQSHPEGAKIQRMLDRTELTSKEQIDDLIEQFREPERDADDLESVRERIRARLSGGREHLTEDAPTERSRTSGRTRSYNGLGVSLAELRHLSGAED